MINHLFESTFDLVSRSPDPLLASIFIIMMSCRPHDVIRIKMEARSGSGLRETTFDHLKLETQMIID